MYFTAALIIIIIIILWVYFHRSPNINVSPAPNEVVSPAYGKVMHIAEKDDYYHIMVFLSPSDVHVQYYPIAGKVTSQIYDNTGKYHLAYELNKSNENEKSITNMTTLIGDVQITQIAGMVARRIVTYPKSGPVQAGEILGRIRLGSRVDLKIPKKDAKLLVKVGDYLRGPYTVVAVYRTLSEGLR
jgi:phosphatidylserine decarboxylase